MKRKIKFLFFLILIFAFAQISKAQNKQLHYTSYGKDSTKTEVDWYNNHQKRKEIITEPNGIEVKKYWCANGQLLLKDSLKNHLLINRLVCNDTKGVPLNIGTFKNGNGILLSYSDMEYFYGGDNTDKVKTSYTYKNGRRYGLTVTYFDYPKDTSGIYHYDKNGAVTGKYIQYFSNHKEAEVGYYKSGQQQGLVKTYNTDGKLIEESNYVNGKLISKKDFLNENKVVDDKKRIAIINSFLNALKTNYNPDSVRFKYYYPKVLALLYSKYLAFSESDTSDIYQQQKVDIRTENNLIKELSDSVKKNKYIVLNYKTAEIKYPHVASYSRYSSSPTNSYYYSLKDVFVIVFEKKFYRYILMRGNKIQDILYGIYNPKALDYWVFPVDYGYTYKVNFWDDTVKIPLILKK
ncbi:MAG: hypothetical protein ABI199_04270 [Bacteroidia bacterium]